MAVKWFVRSAVVIALALAITGFPWSGRAEDVRWGKRPAQFYQALESAPMLGSGKILGIGHNAGDGASASDLALAHGADMIEINVVSYGGRLYSAHDTPPDWLPTMAYRGRTLQQAWAQAAAAQYIEFDLKDASPAMLRKLVSFLDAHQDGRRIFISSRDLNALETLREHYPAAIRLLSINTRNSLDRLLDDPSQIAPLNGVSIRATLLDNETVAWFKNHGLLVIAWTVNDEALLNDVIASGVDAIATDNLAILDALSEAQARRDRIDLSRLEP